MPFREALLASSGYAALAGEGRRDGLLDFHRLASVRERSRNCAKSGNLLWRATTEELSLLSAPETVGDGGS